MGIVLSGAACVTPDPLPSDPPGFDVAAPAATVPFTEVVSGDTLRGVACLPPGPGPHPILLLLHGFPGLESNHDLAQAARRAGWSVVTFHYRGSWGSGGTFGFYRALQDTRAVLERLRSRAGASAIRGDPARVVVAGHSTGGFLALMAGAGDVGVRGVASMAGFDFGAHIRAIRHDSSATAETLTAFAEGAAMLDGTSGPALVAEMRTAAEGWELGSLAPRLQGREVLLVSARFDDVAPPARHHEPLVAAYTAAGVALTVRDLDADHGFSNRRVALTRVLLDWLGTVGGER